MTEDPRIAGKRLRDMRRRRAIGHTLREIAEVWGVTAARVSQILSDGARQAERTAHSDEARVEQTGRGRATPAQSDPWYPNFRRRTTVPVRDPAGRVVALVDVYGVVWGDLAVVPGGGEPVRRTLERVGLDPHRYSGSIFDLGPQCETEPFPRGPLNGRIYY